MSFHTISCLLAGGRLVATYLRLNIFAVRSISPYTKCLVYFSVFPHVIEEGCATLGLLQKAALWP